MAARGYTLCISYPPTWMDWPMLKSGNPDVIKPGMVFFIHIILFDKASGSCICIGVTAIVTKGACERINQVPRQVIGN